MKQLFYILLSAISLFGCSFPDELPVSENSKPADTFARQFINRIITGELDNSYSMLEPESLNEQTREVISRTSQNIHRAKVKSIRVVEANYTTGYFTGTGTFSNYRLSYEYEFDKGNILFITSIKEADGEIYITGFDGQFLNAPLRELTKFTLADKPISDYLFLFICTLIPLFILYTFINMLFIKMSVKRKIIWGLVILLVCLPKFILNWQTGYMDFRLLNINLLASGFGRPNLYSPWFLSFSLPIGALIYWFRRERLINTESTNTRQEAALPSEIS